MHKKAMRVVRGLSLCLLLLVGCTKQITYQPSILDTANPKETVERFLRSNHTGTPIGEIEVTDKYIKFVQLHETLNRRAIALAAVTKTPAMNTTTAYYAEKYLYYQNIGKVEMFKKNYYWVEIYDKGAQLLFWVYSYDEKDIKEFLDALYSMMNAN
ncbi:exported hypothetical protein [uncultured Desulfobacterium sp.]|uniref:Lipoprotein n=1 Tax=uncultured Desulfobacterium sp. TaxID=201089 RepID=A0A445MV96_9BACT|nr:exported hypothetical protein [uncultured Desulfobacterium sp.]